MQRGRPTKSQVRQNLIEILFFKKKATGYELGKLHNQIFSNCTSRLVYYHLKKGEALKEFKITHIVKEQGNFSWGTTAEKIYYELGENASPMMDSRVKEWMEKDLRDSDPVQAIPDQ